jgi:FHA domain
VLKWVEPLDSARPSKKWRLYVFKDNEISETLHLHRQSAYLFGRDKRVADVELKHESCSKQHAVIQYRCVCLFHVDSVVCDKNLSILGCDEIVISYAPTAEYALKSIEMSAEQLS